MVTILFLLIGTLLCFGLGLLYLFDKAFVRAIARDPAAVTTPMGAVMTALIGLVLISAALLLGAAAWHAFVAWRATTP